MGQDEFYIGYLPEAPLGFARFVKRAILTVLGIVAVVAVLLVTGQGAFYASAFEFGTYRTFEGVVSEKPYAMLLVQRPGEIGSLSQQSRYYLVAFGKFGANDLVSGMDGKRVKLQGSLIYRDNQTMIEIQEGSVEVVAGSAPVSGGGQSLGNFELIGEIVDSKCFFGVMNPGNLKPHKACAIRCSSGGIPPVFVVRNHAGETSYFLLVSEEGKAVNTQVLDLVAEPVRISGELVRQGDLLVLKSDPATYKRVQ